MNRLKCGLTNTRVFVMISVYSYNALDVRALLPLTVNLLNIQTPKKFVVITQKFELCRSTIE